MATDPAVQQIYRLWAITLALGGLMLFGVVSALRRGEYVIPLVVPAILVVVFVGRYALLRKQAALLRAPDSSVAIQYYAAAIRRGPGADALRAHASAVVAAYYGDYDKAEDCLASVDWDGRGGLYEAMPLYVRALLDYWRDCNVARGLTLAERARSMAATPSLPGAATTRLAYDVLVATGHVLAARTSEQDFSILATGRKKLPLMGRLLATWATAIAQHDAGHLAESDVLFSSIRAAAPHCRPLLEVPPRRLHEGRLTTVSGLLPSSETSSLTSSF